MRSEAKWLSETEWNVRDKLIQAWGWLANYEEGSQ